MRQAVKIVILFFALTWGLLPLNINFRYSDDTGTTRIVFEATGKFEYKISALDDRIEIVVPQRIEFKETSFPASSQLVDRVTIETGRDQSLLKAFFKDGYRILRHFVLENPFRLVFDLEKAPRPVLKPEPQTAGKEPQPQIPEKVQAQAATANQETRPPAITPSKKKAIDIICIDPGHGGSDLGALGKSGAMEKNLTLGIAKKLKNLVESRLGLRVIMSRDRDEEVSLNTRASTANNQQAQMFVSIHINSSFRRTAYGSEIYFVSLNATDQEALELAQKENSSKENIGEEIQNDELKLILWNMAQTEYIKESSKLAEFIQSELNELLGTRNRGVKQAPFRVLMRAAMPSVLIEVAFLSNPSEVKKLLDEEFQSKVALAIFAGISKFISYYNSSLK